MTKDDSLHSTEQRKTEMRDARSGLAVGQKLEQYIFLRNRTDETKTVRLLNMSNVISLLSKLINSH